MSKKNLFLIFFISLFLIGVKFYDKLQNEIFYLTNPIKTFYFNIRENITNIIEMHFSQAKTISKLKKENLELNKYLLKYRYLKDDYESLKRECNISFNTSYDLKLAKAIAYEKFNDFSSMWLEFKDFNKSKIYGLIKDGFAAGIVIDKNSNPLALLNSNKKCAYAVEIGKDKASGIANGTDNGLMIINFIPMYKNIKVGDEVVTSGLDKIFFYGVKVGKVLKIEKRGGYKIAFIKPYANLLHPRYFWVTSPNF